MKLLHEPGALYNLDKFDASNLLLPPPGQYAARIYKIQFKRKILDLAQLQNKFINSLTLSWVVQEGPWRNYHLACQHLHTYDAEAANGDRLMETARQVNVRLIENEVAVNNTLLVLLKNEPRKEHTLKILKNELMDDVLSATIIDRTGQLGEVFLGKMALVAAARHPNKEWNEIPMCGVQPIK